MDYTLVMLNPRRRFPLSALAAVLLAGTAPLALHGAPAAKPPAAPALPIAYGPGREIAKLANPVVTESSGIACSRSTPGVFWTHNDSGSPPQLHAFNMKGEDLGTWRVQGAEAADWEDMASFTLGGRHYLMIADIGDNKSERSHCTIYIALEPPAVALQPKLPPLSLTSRMDFTYEDGPRNCESAAVDPVRREILLVSKTGGAECKAYVLPLPAEKSPKKTVAKAVATLSIPTTSAMDVSPDGLRAVVLTYGNAFEYARQASEDWGKAFARPPRQLRMPPRAQGESVCYGPDGVTIYLTSEKLPTPLLEVSPEAR
jgi:hypothetical protein